MKTSDTFDSRGYTLLLLIMKYSWIKSFHRNKKKIQAGVCCGPCNPSKWEVDIWGWLEVRRSAILHYTVNQRPHWARCWEMDTSQSANCHQPAAVGHWVSLCVCIVVEWLIVYQLSILSLSCSQYSQTICWRGWDDNACLGIGNTSSIGAWPNFLDRRLLWYCIVSSLLQTNKQTKNPFTFQASWTLTYII